MGNPAKASMVEILLSFLCHLPEEGVDADLD